MADMEQSQRILSCLPMVKCLAERFSRLFPHIDFDDFQSAGHCGLSRSALLFDAKRGYAFSTYAWHGITNAMRNLIRSEKRYSRLVSHDEEGYPVADQTDRFADVELSDQIDALLKCLNRREREFVRLRFLEGWIQQKISEQWNVSRQYVSQYEIAVLKKLRKNANVTASTKVTKITKITKITNNCIR